MAVKGEAYGTVHQTNCLAYTWVLKDFSKIVSKYGKPGYSVTSQCFEPIEDGPAQICLVLYPGGYDEQHSEYVSVFVSCFKSQKKVVSQKCTLVLKSSTGKTILSDSNRDYRPLEPGQGWGPADLVTRKALLEQLPDDVLVVSVEMTYCLTVLQKRGGGVQEIAEQSPLMTTVEDFSAARTMAAQSDVVILAQGEEIPAHRFVLAARSKVFSSMFDHDVLEKRTGRIEIVDFGASTVESMLQFMYGGNVQNMDTSAALELLRAADKYDIAGLKSFCSSFVLSHVDKQNVFDVLLAADAHSVEELRTKAIDFVCENRRSLDFKSRVSIFSQNSDLFRDIITRMSKK